MLSLLGKPVNRRFYLSVQVEIRMLWMQTEFIGHLGQC